MEVRLKSTEKIVTLVVNGHSVPARVWEGETIAGIKCHAFITRIAVASEDNASEFERDLREHATPSAVVEGIPLRLLIG
jgi:hypothetical protein